MFEIIVVVKEVIEVVKFGDLYCFFGGDKSVGVFMNGFFFVMMFGLLGVVFVMYLVVLVECCY